MPGKAVPERSGATFSFDRQSSIASGRRTRGAAMPLSKAIEPGSVGFGVAPSAARKSNGPCCQGGGSSGSRSVRRSPRAEVGVNCVAGEDCVVRAIGKSSSYTRRVMCGMARITSIGAVLTLIRPGVSLPSKFRARRRRRFSAAARSAKSITPSGGAVVEKASKGCAPRSSTVKASSSTTPPGRRLLNPEPFWRSRFAVAVSAGSNTGGSTCTPESMFGRLLALATVSNWAGSRRSRL